MIRILIADDHAVVREGVANILSASCDMNVVATASSGGEALQSIRAHTVDVALLDLSMPGMNGLETLKQIRIEFPDLPVLILSMHPEDQYAVRCVKAGASGYLTKDCSKDDLLSAVRRVAVGQQYLTPEVTGQLLDAVRRRESGEASHHALSDRELEVFRSIAAGQSLSETAEYMHLSPKTVSTYRTRILEKTGLRNNNDIMRYAFENGLVSAPPTMRG